MELKEAAARQALKYVENDMLLGLGSGSTVAFFIRLLGLSWQRHEIKGIRAVPTSKASANLAASFGLPLASLNELDHLDLAVDGADEVDPNLNLIKGLGLALLREKVVEIHARRFVVIVDESKLVKRLGRGALPVEILPFEYEAHLRWLNSLGCRAELWRDETGQPLLTDNGNYYCRCHFADGIHNLAKLAWLLNERPGIIEHGLFINMANEVLVAGTGAMKRLVKDPDNGLVSEEWLDGSL
ncbi:MAG: ribose-5-phosphate isomerase RpiA [Anaerolineae bacterium]|nr:ribose-5-phosphate isomerase RpiA [Anaerolineae bacterium]